jgi:hypothetical protein
MGEVIRVLFGGEEDDPNGTFTCSCGEVFTGASIQDRWEQWVAHTSTCEDRA